MSFGIEPTEFERPLRPCAFLCAPHAVRIANALVVSGGLPPAWPGVRALSGKRPDEAHASARAMSRVNGSDLAFCPGLAFLWHNLFGPGDAFLICPFAEAAT